MRNVNCIRVGGNVAIFTIIINTHKQTHFKNRSVSFSSLSVSVYASPHNETDLQLRGVRRSICCRRHCSETLARLASYRAAISVPHSCEWLCIVFREHRTRTRTHTPTPIWSGHQTRPCRSKVVLHFAKLKLRTQRPGFSASNCLRCFAEC